jgi:4-carboxymuconolactone decarboxylase
MTEETSYERGQRKIDEVYAGQVVNMPEGTMAFYDVMMKSLFAEVWDRDVLSIRDRRLLIMGVIAASGKTDVWAIQAKAALMREELTPEQLRETLIMLAPYAGYPNVADLISHCESVIAEWTKEQSAGTD